MGKGNDDECDITHPHFSVGNLDCTRGMQTLEMQFPLKLSVSFEQNKCCKLYGINLIYDLPLFPSVQACIVTLYYIEIPLVIETTVSLISFLTGDVQIFEFLNIAC